MLAMARRFLPWIGAASPQERFISYLPMAHVGERMLAHYGHAVWGFQVTCCPDPKLVLGMLTEVCPTAFFAPPRLFEKLRAAIVAGGEEDAAPTLRALGLDAVRCAVTSGAPVPAELIRFHNRIGLPLVEGYGSSELGGMAACNRPGESKIGSAGPALPGFEARIARDGELEMRGPSMMVGYRGRVQETAAALGPDGWLRTGDIAELDDEGCLRIVGRKKEIIINAMGKNMSPANIESALKSACPMIGQVCCVGDSRPYNVALIALDPEAVGDVERAASDQRVLAELAAGVRCANSRLSRVEQIKRHAVLGTEWLPDSDELTATMKLKRRAIATKYAPEIEALYHAQSETSASGLQNV
jgi:long-subunit acyl-CoA synthetase (AMP-forming)